MSNRFALQSSELSPQWREKAKKELRETPELVKESVAKLRELLKNDNSVFYNDDDTNLIRYLRPCKFYPESALALMKRAAEFKEKNPTAVNILPKDLEEKILATTAVNILVDRDQDGRRILLLHHGSVWDPSKDPAEFVFQCLYLAHLGAMLEEDTQVNGVIVILDFKGMGMKQVTALGPTVSMRLLSFIQEAMPLRLKEVHIIFEPMIFNIVWKVFTPFIKEKLKKRIHFHGSKTSSLHKFVNPKNLPKDYGGELPAVDYSLKTWYPVLHGINDYIAASNKQGIVKK